MYSQTPSSAFGSGIPEAEPCQRSTSPAPAHTPQAGQCYRVDSSRTSYTELWRDTRSPLVLIIWLSKLLRIRLPGSVNDPNVVSLRPFLVDAGAVQETIPADVRQELQPVVRELTDLGFREAVCFLINDLFHHSRTCQVALLHRNGRSVARVTHRLEGAQTSKTHFFTEFLSELAGGTFLHSSTARSQMFAPAVCRLNWEPKATTSQLWVSHRQKLDAAGQSGAPPVVINGCDEMVYVLERHHEAVRDFHLARGVFSSMQDEDLAQAAELDENIEQSRSGRMQYPEVMAQLGRLQKRQTSWTGAILVLIISIGLFIGVGAGAWKLSWQVLLAIVGILLVHESGHYLAMRIFNYRNVRMFFIPFLGAAVSGQHYTAPGWKKVIVSLMGPLPGIFLGGVLGIAGIIKGNDAMMKLATMAIILNGFQLLPVLPLDGGRVMHALLFSRHHYLDTVFQVLAASALVGLGALFGDKVLVYLGVFMFIGVPAAFKIAKITMELRRQGFRPGGSIPAAASPGATGPLFALPPDNAAVTPHPTAAIGQATPMATFPATAAPAEEHSIPQPVAEAIIERFQARFPKLKSPKQIAALTLRVYETLATRPPGIVASIGLAFLHGASFLVALVLLLVLIIPQSPALMALIAANRPVPTRSIEPDAIVTWCQTSDRPGFSADDAGPIADPTTPTFDKYETIIATFSTTGAARRAFDRVKQEAPASPSLVYFGQSVLLSLPSADESARMRWFDEFEGRAEDVFIDGGGEFGASLTLTCVASDEPQASRIEQQVSSFFQMPSALCLIPPWAGDDLDRRTEEERRRHETARATYAKLQQTYVSDAPELEALRDDMIRAARRNNQAEYERISKQQSELEKQLFLRELQRIGDNETDPIARELADRYIAIQTDARATEEAEATPDEAEDVDWDAWTYEAFARQREDLGPLMGQLPLLPDTGRPAPRALGYSHSYGYVQRAGRHRLLAWISFEDISKGAPAFVKWLGRIGCRNFQYEFSGAGVLEYDEYE